MTEAVQEAVAAAFEENVRFDVRANFYTLIAITGVVLYWRGVWNSWQVLSDVCSFVAKQADNHHDRACFQAACIVI